jgi:hypothetical protein
MLYDHLVKRSGKQARQVAGPVSAGARIAPARPVRFSAEPRRGTLAADPQAPLPWEDSVLVNGKAAALKLNLPPAMALRLWQMWQACPQCVPVGSDGTVDQATLETVLLLINQNKRIACDCAQYLMMPVTVQENLDTWSHLSDSFKQIPFGWGWLKFDDKGEPVTSYPRGAITGQVCVNGTWDEATQACKPNAELPAPAKQANASTSSSGSSDSSGTLTLLALGALAIGIVAFVGGAGGKEQALERAKVLGSEGYEGGKKLAQRGYAAAKPYAERAFAHNPRGFHA